MHAHCTLTQSVSHTFKHTNNYINTNSAQKETIQSAESKMYENINKNA